jgi:hypothetical protein
MRLSEPCFRGAQVIYVQDAGVSCVAKHFILVSRELRFRIEHRLIIFCYAMQYEQESMPVSALPHDQHADRSHQLSEICMDRPHRTAFSPLPLSCPSTRMPMTRQPTSCMLGHSQRQFVQEQRTS